MRKFQNITQSDSEPSTQDIWIKEGIPYYYSAGTWQPLSTKNKGTITSIKMNGEIKGDCDEVDLGEVLTEHQDISKKQDIIPDLQTIRSNALKGAMAIQKLSKMLGVPTDNQPVAPEFLTNKSKVVDVVTKVNEIITSLISCGVYKTNE